VLSGLRRWAARARGEALPDVVAGCAVAIFSVSEGMAFAAVGGFPPAVGLYAGIIPVAVAALLTPNPLMITTLTSAIALTAQSALARADLNAADPRAVAALTFTVGLVMAVSALAGVGRLLGWIPRSALSAFSAGVALQIFVSGTSRATGLGCGGHTDLGCLLPLIEHPARGSQVDMGLALCCLVLWCLMHSIARLRAVALPAAAVIAAVVVALTRLRVPITASLGAMPHSLPAPVVPLWSLVPSLAPGACVVAAAALAQAVSISSRLAEDEPPRTGAVILTQSVANLAGAFCQALPVGGSLSRTAVAVATGGRSRSTGLYAAAALAGLVCLGGSWIGRIPLPAVGVLLAVIGAELLAVRMTEAGSLARTSPGSFALFAGVFALGAVGPVEYALGASIVAGVVVRATAAIRVWQASLRARRPDRVAR
jgi:SulP family sulfate permease